MELRGEVLDRRTQSQQAPGALQQKDALTKSGIQNVIGWRAQRPARQQSGNERWGTDKALRFQQVFHTGVGLHSNRPTRVVMSHCGEKPGGLQGEKRLVSGGTTQDYNIWPKKFSTPAALWKVSVNR